MFSKLYNSRIVNGAGKRGRPVMWPLALACLVFILSASVSYPTPRADSAPPQASQYKARITHQDTNDFPFIKAYLSITDGQGNPIPDNLQVKLAVYEDGKPVSQKTLSEGWSVSSVLVLDVSGSMNKDDKLAKAKEAAINYIKSAPEPYQIAVVAFSNTPSIIGTFTDSRDRLCRSIAGLRAGGATALQDALGAALDLLGGRRDRKAVTLLTDGMENQSKKYPDDQGRRQLINRANKEGCSVFTIGLDEVQHDYLRSYEETGGKYLFSPNKDELGQVFERSVNLLKQEVVVEYTSLSKELDGSVKNVSFELSVGDKKSVSEGAVTSPGVIPHVPGDHTPWMIGIVTLLFVPATFSLGLHFLQVYRFRSSYIKRLEPASPYVGKRDLNEGLQGHPLAAGDLAVICPNCDAAHRVRSWRMNRCKCMRDGTGKGSYCYHQKMPERVRHLLDDLSGKRLDEERGRTWLCFCAGDRSKDRRGY
ncbi:MAG: vWA domain-containing protein [Blastocatellia bacterium]